MPAGRKSRDFFKMAEAQKAVETEKEPPKFDMQMLLNTPEFQEAVKAGVMQALAATAPSSLASGVDDQTKELFSGMAHAIAEMSYQGNGRGKPVAPEVIAKREAAANKLEELIIHAFYMAKEAKERGDIEGACRWTPEYQVTSKIYFNEQFIEPYYRDAATKRAISREIYWSGMPCEALTPINQVAKEIYAAYKESIGGAVQLSKVKGPNGGVVEQDGRPVWMTPGGLILKGDAPERFILDAGKPATPRFPTDANNPETPLLHVLGTVAPPAQRNFAEKQQPVRSI